MNDQTYLSKDWLTDPDFKNWLTDTNDNTAACCKVCHLNYLIWKGKHSKSWQW